MPGGNPDLRIPREGHRGFVEVYNCAWNRIEDEKSLLASSGAAIASLARECRRFLR